MQPGHAIILGLVEGITEYLPISSTGHLILTKGLLGLDTSPQATKAVDDFIIVIQGGAILAVLGLYWRRVLQMVKGLLGNDPKGLRLFINLVVAFLPAAFFGLLLDDWIESKLFSTGPVLLALFVGGLFMMLVEARRTGRFAFPWIARQSPPPYHATLKEIDDLTPRDALLIGLMQCIAMWPGTSRSMMTIVGGFLVGLRPRAAAEFSFLLGLPTLGGAMLYTLAKDFRNASKTGQPTMIEALGTTNVVIGVAVATISAALAVKWLVSFLNRKGLTPFGWYRIVLALVLAFLIWRGVITPIGGGTVTHGGSEVVKPLEFTPSEPRP